MDELRQIVQQILAIVNEIAQSGEQISDDVANSLSDFLESAYQRLQPIQQPIPELNNAPYPSSNINAFKYNPKDKELFVKFQDKYPYTNGPIYKYSDVPEFIFNIFSRGAIGPKTSGSNRWHTWKKGVMPSLGAAMDALLKKGGFSYQRLT